MEKVTTLHRYEGDNEELDPHLRHLRIQQRFFVGVKYSSLRKEEDRACPSEHTDRGGSTNPADSCRSHTPLEKFELPLGHDDFCSWIARSVFSKSCRVRGSVLRLLLI